MLTVKCSLKAWQVLVADVEATVLRDPVSEGVDADVAERVAVHVVEDARGVQLELVTFIIDLIFSLDDQAKERGQLLEPSPLE